MKKVYLAPLDNYWPIAVFLIEYLKMEVLEKLITALKRRNLTLALAESCSGGYASYLLTKIPGSSEVFKGGSIVYSLNAKNKLFNIPWELLKKHQGASETIALMLAERVRRRFNADIGGAIVGFAGPKAKKGVKVGTVFIAMGRKNVAASKKLLIKASRDGVRKKASAVLIDLLYRNLPKK